MTTMRRYQRVIEVNGREKVSLPIVKFPPFKLRAAMIEKDPVIWLHLLEVYVSHIRYLLHGDNLDFISDQTYDHLCVFTRAYLHEMSDEEGKLLSLGMNSDVLEQLRLLRAYMFQLIKSCGLLYLQISTETLWDIVRVYVAQNPYTVRKLVDGSLKPTINTQKAQLDRTYQIQQHIRNMIEANKFSRVDLKTLELLLNAGPLSKNTFADNFVSTKWVDTLESMYGKEPGSYLSDWGKKLGILSYLSCSVGNLADLLKEMGVTNLQTLSMYPLLGSLLIDPEFQKRVPMIKSKIGFIDVLESDDSESQSHSKASVKLNAVDESKLSMIKELFPDLNTHQITQLLLRYDNNTEIIINNLFENPSIIDSLEDEETVQQEQDIEQQQHQDQSKPYEISAQEHQREKTALPTITPQDKIVKKEISFPVNDVPDSIRNKTLSRALALLYDATEDERDDTYDEAEVKQASSSRVSIDIGNKSTGNNEEEIHQPETTSKYDQIEGYLWELLKRDKVLFTRQKRGSKQRSDMKKQTGWSDEQIEGWSRMIEKSPKRAQLLEEKYIFKGNVRQGKKNRSYNNTRSEDADTANEEEESKDEKPSGKSKTGNKPNQPVSKEQQKRKNARNEKNKSSRANHNRKAGHDKKLARSGVP
ncbi:hypothetical protein C6P43_001661 [Kluyveromyces marxianus]|nr:hypothetical protein C6P43_001661 [Kluyveromyces marxianus]